MDLSKLALIAVILLIAGGLLAWRAMKKRRTREIPSSFPLGAIPQTAPQADHFPASIVTELLTDSLADELMLKAMPLEGEPQLCKLITTTIGPALQTVLDGTAKVTQRGRFLVEFSAEGSDALNSGAVTFLSRVDGRLQPTLVNSAAKIEENAVMVGRTGQRIASAVAVGHMVILLAVQAQLVFMERKLDRIEKKIDDLRRFLDDEQFSRVRGRLKQLTSLLEEISSDHPSDEDRQRLLGTLDRADVELIQVDELASAQCISASMYIENARLKVKLFGSSGTTLFDEFYDKINRFQQYHDLRELVILGRLVIAHMKEVLGKAIGVPQLEVDIASLETSADVHYESLARRAPEYRTKFRKNPHELEKQKRLMQNASEFRIRSEGALRQLRIAVGALACEARKSARVIVELDDNGQLQPLALLPQSSE